MHYIVLALFLLGLGTAVLWFYHRFIARTG